MLLADDEVGEDAKETPMKLADRYREEGRKQGHDEAAKKAAKKANEPSC